MEAANGSFVPMDDLQKKVGVAIGDMIDNVNGAGDYPTRALVTSGCAGAMTLASAAAMAGDDPAKIIQLPDTTGMPCEVLIQSNQRYHYDRAWEFAGAKLVEYEPTVEALQVAINHRTVACVSRPPKFFPGSLPISTIAEIAHAKGVYVMVDAAGETFPLEDLTRYIKEGADVQCVATKYIGASQSTGIALGSEEFIHKMFLQTFVGFEVRKCFPQYPTSAIALTHARYEQTPNDGHDTGWSTPKDFGRGIGEKAAFLGGGWYVRGIGRPAKVDRQEVMGVYMALKIWLEMDHKKRVAGYLERSQAIAASIAGTPGVLGVTVDSNRETHDPHGVDIMLDPKAASNVDIM